MTDIKIANATLELYRSLILKRDALRKEGADLEDQYIRTFGELLEERYSLFIECIKYKKILSFCLTRINSGLPIYRNELNHYIENTMNSYYVELHDLSKFLKEKGSTLSEIKIFQIKKLYHKLAMMLHPDLHPNFCNNSEAQELWHKISNAYRNNDYKALKEAEVLAVALLDKQEGTSMEFEVENVEEKIEMLRTEITQIMQEDPYLYKFLLLDEDAIAEKKEELKKDIDEYKNYLETLKKEAETFRIKEDA